MLSFNEFPTSAILGTTLQFILLLFWTIRFYREQRQSNGITKAFYWYYAANTLKTGLTLLVLFWAGSGWPGHHRAIAAWWDTMPHLSAFALLYLTYRLTNDKDE